MQALENSVTDQISLKLVSYSYVLIALRMKGCGWVGTDTGQCFWHIGCILVCKHNAYMTAGLLEASVRISVLYDLHTVCWWEG